MLMPLVVLLGVAFTLTQMVRRNEFLVLQAGGIPVTRTLRILAVPAFVAAGLMLANNEWGVPKWAEIERENQAFFDKRGTVEAKVLVQPDDGRVLWMQTYRSSTRTASALAAIGFDRFSGRPTITFGFDVVYSPRQGWRARAIRVVGEEPDEVLGATVSRLVARDRLPPPVTAVNADAPVPRLPIEGVTVRPPT
jgi:lipopolysaccharide export LptBFGC system permease protein LptF